MSKCFYAIKFKNGNIHCNNLGMINYFSTKENIKIYMKSNHYDGEIVKFYIDNQKDQQIAELQAKVKELKESEKLGIEYEKNAKQCIEYWKKEYAELQQQLQALPKQIVEEIKKWLNDKGTIFEIVSPKSILDCFATLNYEEYLDNLLEKYGGEDESNND